MSEVQPTQGRITFKEDGDANHYSMLTEDGRWWLAILANGEQTSARQVANFRRLAACWNACEGSSTEWLEFQCSPDAIDQFGPREPFETRYTSALRKGVQAMDQRDDLLKALKKCSAILAGENLSKSCLIDALESAQKAMRNATGAQPVPPSGNEVDWAAVGRIIEAHIARGPLVAGSSNWGAAIYRAAHGITAQGGAA